MTANTAVPAIRAALHEALLGPEGEWGTFLLHDTGALDTLSAINAEQASREPAPDRTTLAKMVGHLTTSLEYALKVVNGNDNPEWDSRPEPAVVNAAEWTALQKRLRAAGLALDARLADPEGVNVPTVIGTVAHTAYHVGGIRQIALLLKAAEGRATEGRAAGGQTAEGQAIESKH